MPDYRIQLDAYAGPLDLLLYLVKRHEVDLWDIPIAQLCEGYLEHVEAIRALDPEAAGEFLVMAATLMEIKSRMLLPTAEGEEDAAGEGGGAGDATDGIEGPESDPRFELVQQLLAYRRFKDAARELEERERAWEQRYPVAAGAGEVEGETEGTQIEDASVLDLCRAFARVLSSVGSSPRRQHEVTYDDTPISLHAADIHDRLMREAARLGDTPHHPARLPLRAIFEGRQHRSELIGLFLATLELVRQRRVRVWQDPAGAVGDPAAVHLELRPQSDAEEANAADHTASPATADPAAEPDPADAEQWDWPDEASRRRWERRQRIRAARQAQDDFADLTDRQTLEDVEDGNDDERTGGDI